MVRYGEKRREGTFARNKLKRKEGSGDDTTLIGVYGQVAVQKKQFLLLMQSGSSQASLEDSIKLSFSLWMMGNSLCITTKTFIDHSIVALRFSELPQFQNTLNRGNLSFHHTHTTMYCICGTTTGSCTTLSSTMCKMNNSTHQTTVSSRP